MFRVTARWEDSPDDAVTRINEIVRVAFERGLERATLRAKAEHVFRNRTGALETSIHSNGVTGSAMDDTLEGVLEASEEYASYVVGLTGDDFLRKAFAEEEASIAREIVEAMASAI